MQSINVKELAQRAAAGKVDLIDVRIPTEFRELHAECAKNVPLETLNPKEIAQSRNGRSDQPVYVICKSGNRSTQAVQKFNDAGIDNVINVDGGTTAWAEAGLPVVRGKKAFPLLQQVQLTAGFLVLLGLALAYFVDESFIGLSAFVGAGLMFAGATGICPMSSIIARMPWNQCEDGTSCSV